MKETGYGCDLYSKGVWFIPSKLGISKLVRKMYTSKKQKRYREVLHFHSTSKAGPSPLRNLQAELLQLTISTFKAPDRRFTPRKIGSEKF